MKRGEALKRTGSLKRSGPIRTRSRRGTDYATEYRQAIPRVHARSGGRCEIRSTHDCDGFATACPHHRKLRKQGGSNDVDNLLDVCHTGHDWLHRQLPRSEAVRLQLIVPRDTPEYPYDPCGEVQ